MKPKLRYNSAAWMKARRAYLCEHPMCVMCAQLGQHTFAEVVDHIKPHKDDPELFWDEANWQAICKRCHDSHKRRQDHTGVLRGAHADGTPLDPNHPWYRS